MRRRSTSVRARGKVRQRVTLSMRAACTSPGRFDPQPERQNACMKRLPWPGNISGRDRPRPGNRCGLRPRRALDFDATVSLRFLLCRRLLLQEERT